MWEPGGGQTQMPISVCIYAGTTPERAEDVVSQVQANNQRPVDLWEQSAPDAPWSFVQALPGPSDTDCTTLDADRPRPPALHQKVIAAGEVVIGAALLPPGDAGAVVSSPKIVPPCACGVTQEELTKPGFKRHLPTCSAMKQYRHALQMQRSREQRLSMSGGQHHRALRMRRTLHRWRASDQHQHRP